MGWRTNSSALAGQKQPRRVARAQWGWMKRGECRVHRRKHLYGDNPVFTRICNRVVASVSCSAGKAAERQCFWFSVLLFPSFKVQTCKNFKEMSVVHFILWRHGYGRKKCRRSEQNARIVTAQVSVWVFTRCGALRDVRNMAGISYVKVLLTLT